jgi:hypothetical protein
VTEGFQLGEGVMENGAFEGQIIGELVKVSGDTV